MSDLSPKGEASRAVERAGGHTDHTHEVADHARGGWINGIVRTFLHSNLSLILLVISVALGAAALLVTPREEDPQIVVPLADIYVNAPGLTSQEVERLVTTPLERVLYQIDGVEYVYSMSSEDAAIVTVRFYVGQDRERSLVRLFKKLEESKDLVPPGVAGWVMKPVEIDDVPIVTLTLRGASGSTADEHTLRRVSEELAARLAVVEDTSRVTMTGGLPRVFTAYLDRDAIAGRGLALLDVQRAVRASNTLAPAGDVQRVDQNIPVRAGLVVRDATDLGNLVVGVSAGNPVFLREVARIEDGPSERATYVRHGWGRARGFESHHHGAGTLVGGAAVGGGPSNSGDDAVPAVTIGVAKKKGTNAVNVARAVIREAERLKSQVVPDGLDLVITRNSGLTADEKVSELVEGLWVAILIVVALLTLGLGWRESLVVAVAVPVVFGLTLAVNLIAGYTINRVTLFALILSLGLLVDDPIVDVENIARHFSLRKRASRAITLEAVSEIRPPLISATLAVIASFLPLFFITGMMGPYMRPMALNVPVTMMMSMVVAFTITPWLAFHLLKKRNWRAGVHAGDHHDEFAAARSSLQYRLLRPILQPLLKSRPLAFAFLALVAVLTGAAAMLAGFRQVPLKMLPFDNKAEILLLIDTDEGTALERSDAIVRELESAVAAIPEVTDYTSYVGVNSPIDFNGLVRHYYLRSGSHQGEIRLNLVGKKSRGDASHTLGLRERDRLTAIAAKGGARLKIVELPPGPPVIDTIAAEVYGNDDLPYSALCDAAEVVKARLAAEPGVVEPDDTVETAHNELVFIPDQEKAALSGVSVSEIAATVRAAISGAEIGVVHAPNERQPLVILARLPMADRSSPADLSLIQVRGQSGGASEPLVSLGEIGRWEERPAEQTIYHKNLQRVAYVFAETAGRPPADVLVDVMHDQVDVAAREAGATRGPGGWIDASTPRAMSGRSHLFRGGGIPWAVRDGTRVVWSGEGEWKITLDVFRDLGLAFGAALVMIYVILVAQTGSFMIPVVVMLSIPLTMVGIMPGFWLLGLFSGKAVGGYADPVFFTATAMIGMIALSGIVTRQSIILVDFIHLSIKRGRAFMDAVIEAGAVRLRPILLVVAAAMLSAVPITIDPIFSGLAWALIFGLIASTIFTLFVIPLVYWMLYRNVPGHGVQPAEANDPERTHVDRPA
ncbi:MAG: efflux RND transporter permease subunit [Phycisphaerales bacterium]|nr:efflux RND transporter permease subunit [Phycisphaerales bacterium]